MDPPYPGNRNLCGAENCRQPILLAQTYPIGSLCVLFRATASTSSPPTWGSGNQPHGLITPEAGCRHGAGDRAFPRRPIVATPHPTGSPTGDRRAPPTPPTGVFLCHSGCPVNAGGGDPRQTGRHIRPLRWIGWHVRPNAGVTIHTPPTVRRPGPHSPCGARTAARRLAARPAAERLAAAWGCRRARTRLARARGPGSRRTGTAQGRGRAPLTARDCARPPMRGQRFGSR